MITIKINLRVWLTVVGMFTVLQSGTPSSYLEKSYVVEDTLVVDHDWEYLFEALSIVESTNNPMAVNQVTGARGLIQIMCQGDGGYLDEYHRLTGDYSISDDDLFSPITSRKIFDRIQLAKNPHKDIEKAIKIHNPRGGKLYKYEVLMNFYKLKSEGI